MVHLLGVLDRDHDRRRPRVQPEVERRGASVLEQALLEAGVNPSAGNETGSVRRRAGDEPVDVPANVLPLNDALLDEELFECPRPRRGRPLVARDRLVRMIVLVS